jgi:hypothetical protein
MAQSFNCKCGERSKPLEDRNWEVLKYKCHHSAFNGYRRTYSEYSTVICNQPGCPGLGRTKAAYVDELMAVGKYRKGACLL